MRPMRVKVAPSQIEGAGLGLYLMQNARMGKRIARYSGKAMTLDEKTESDNRAGRHSQYCVKIHNNLYLDAADSRHFEGRFINDASRAKGFKVNARFAAGYTVNECSTTGFKWVSIFATRRIRAGEEIFLDYGDEFWVNMRNNDHQPHTHTPNVTTPITTDSTPRISPWAAAAPIPFSFSSIHHTHHSQPYTYTAPTTPRHNTTQWAAPAAYIPTTPHSPIILGHHTHKRHIFSFTNHPKWDTPLSISSISIEC